jgi:hypothetical protein
MRFKEYSSSLSAKGWQVINKVIHMQRKSMRDLQEILNAILYLKKRLYAA